MSANECPVGAVAIALQGAAEARRDDRFKAGRGMAGLPMKERVAAGTRAGPEIAELGRAMIGREIYLPRVF
jgi:hypothetical protein